MPTKAADGGTESGKKLEQVFEETAKTDTGSLGIGFRDMNSGETLFYNGDKVFPLASVYKIFILFELFRRQKLGAFSFSDRHTLPEKEKSIGSGILELIGEGAVFSMMDLTMLIMFISDNAAAKLLQQYTTDEEINAWGEFGTALLAQLSRDIYDILLHITVNKERICHAYRWNRIVSCRKCLL